MRSEKTADYYSVVVALPSREARAVFERLSANQRLGVLVGPKDQTVTEFAVNKRPDKARIAEAFKGQMPRPGMVEGATVDVDQDALDELESSADACEMVPSQQMAVLSALDRVIALPHGVSLLDGKAIARLSPDDQELLEEEWSHLLDRLGGADYVAELVGPHVGGTDGEADALQMIDALDEVVKTARKKKLDVLLLCCPVPT